jgi:hypothetical protein
MNKDMRTIYTALVILLMVNVASASFFDDLRDRFIPAPQRYEPITQPRDDFNTFYSEISGYNTPAVITLISDYMSDYRQDVIRVHVIEYNQDFYIIRGSGILLQPHSHIDRSISLTKAQIRQIAGFMADGELSWPEQWQMYNIYKPG